jgi:TPR repeat protein
MNLRWLLANLFLSTLTALPLHAATQTISEMRHAAERGDLEAQNNLGMAYDEGAGVPQDFEQAVVWFRRAAEQGHVAAQANLGLMYAEGEGVAQDYVQAYKWFNLASAKGDAIGINNRNILSRNMTPDQLAEAQGLSTEWQTAFEKRQEKK